MRALSISLVLLVACDRPEVVSSPLPAGPVPGVKSVPPAWPLRHKPCTDPPDEEQCQTKRYTDSYHHLQGMEVGGMEMMLGEGFEGLAAYAALILPPGGGNPTLEHCNTLSRNEVAVPVESLTRPQRDCYYHCLGGTDSTACIRRERCAQLPALDGSWAILRIVPRLACLAEVRRPASRCDALDDRVESFVPERVTCSPRRTCETGGTGVPKNLEPFVIPAQTPCALRPATWVCEQERLDFPRARCAFGS